MWHEWAPVRSEAIATGRNLEAEARDVSATSTAQDNFELDDSDPEDSFKAASTPWKTESEMQAYVRSQW